MHRTDPLDALKPGAASADCADSRRAKIPSAKSAKSADNLAAEIAAVADATLAYLAAGPRQTPEEYARCLAQVAAIRDQFLTYAAQHPAHPHWRAAWAGFRPQLILESAKDAQAEVHTTTTVSTAHYAVPITVTPDDWRARMKARADALA